MKKKRSARSRGMLLAIFGIAAIAALVLIINLPTPPMHCVSSETGDYRCFDSQAEAINYATGGRLNLPHDASQAEIDAALRALDSQTS